MKNRNNQATHCCTDTILMIEPVAFDHNHETAVNNYFQQKNDETADSSQEKALAEFTNMVNKLREEGVHVITVKDTPYPHTPDSIFPNNWISFHTNNHVVFYPMYAENRRLERRMDILLEVEKELGRKFHYTDYSEYENAGIILEGTGSYVPDRSKRLAYASVSPRTDESLFRKFCVENDYKPVVFNATQKHEGELLPIYHTNVIMCVASKCVIICMDTIRDTEERKMITEEIEKSGKEVFEITEEQMNNFAGNMIQIENKNGEALLCMSQAAYDSLREEQVTRLEKHYKLMVFPIPTIEKLGGGSVRCMICEVF